MYIDSFSFSNRGKYRENEDSTLCMDNVFAVADGLGGHGNGALASSCAIGYISRNYTDFFEKSPAELLKNANSAVFSLNNGSRTTIAAAFISDGKLGYTNAGDSRVYIFRNGKIICRTKDHSVCQASVDAGLITEDQIRHNDDRSKLLKVLGDSMEFKPPKENETITLQSGDAFLICSDGFWEYVYEEEMEIDFLKSGTAKEWAEYMLRRHLKRSECECDNFSVVCGIVCGETEVPKAVVPKKKKGKAAIITIAAAAVLIISAVSVSVFNNLKPAESPVIGASDISSDSERE